MTKDLDVTKLVKNICLYVDEKSPKYIPRTGEKGIWLPINKQKIYSLIGRNNTGKSSLIDYFVNKSKSESMPSNSSQSDFVSMTINHAAIFNWFKGIISSISNKNENSNWRKHETKLKDKRQAEKFRKDIETWSELSDMLGSIVGLNVKQVFECLWSISMKYLIKNFPRNFFINEDPELLDELLGQKEIIKSKNRMDLEKLNIFKESPWAFWLFDEIAFLFERLLQMEEDLSKYVNSISFISIKKETLSDTGLTNNFNIQIGLSIMDNNEISEQQGNHYTRRIQGSAPSFSQTLFNLFKTNLTNHLKRKFSKKFSYLFMSTANNYISRNYNYQEVPKLWKEGCNFDELIDFIGGGRKIKGWRQIISSNMEWKI